MHKFNWDWSLSSLRNKPLNKGNVFSCFAGGGGSSMGYKLAGFNVVGALEIDKKMAASYVLNLGPKYMFCMPIQEFLTIEHYPDILYNLDILDGSPPCSSFSMAGKREKLWGKSKKFREGQADQVLDTLFFDFLSLANKLKPKVIIAENVPGLLMGSAKTYFIKIISTLKEYGYIPIYKILNSSKMGVPQIRKRLIILGIRSALCEKLPKRGFLEEPYINLKFNECPIPFKDICSEKGITKGISNNLRKLMQYRRPTDSSIESIRKRVLHKNGGFTMHIWKQHLPVPTLISGSRPTRDCDGLYPSKEDFIRVSTFPKDYKFLDKARYVCGMSVPPIMMANIANRVYKYWLQPSI